MGFHFGTVDDLRPQSRWYLQLLDRIFTARSVCAAIYGLRRMKGEGLGTGLMVGNSAFICSLHAVTQDTVQGYTFSLDLALSNTSVTKSQLTPSISLA